MNVRSDRMRAAVTLRRLEMPRAEIRAALRAQDPEIVRQYLELHRERLEEQLEDRGRALAALKGTLTEHLQAPARGTERPRGSRSPDLSPTG